MTGRDFEFWRNVLEVKWPEMVSVRTRIGFIRSDCFEIGAVRVYSGPIGSLSLNLRFAHESRTV